MPFISRLSRLVRANANALVSSIEDPAKILDQALMDMQGELVNLRYAVSMAVASQKNIETQLRQAHDQADHWYGCAQAVLQEGNNEEMAREALARCKPYEEMAQDLSRQLKSQAVQVDNLKLSLLQLESKVAQAKAKRSTLKARAQSVQAQKNLDGCGASGISTDSAIEAFERMEEKVEAMETDIAAVAHPFPTLSGDFESKDLDARFQELKSRLHSSK